MSSDTTDTAVSPVVGAILMVAVTVILSATVGVFVFQMQPSGPGDTQSAVRVEETGTGVSVTAVSLDQSVVVQYEGTPVTTLTSVGDTATIPAAPDETVTVISAPDSGKRTVLARHTVQSNPSLVGYWRLEEGSNNTTADASEYNHTGTLVNGPTVTDGVLGSGFQFQDGTDDYVRAMNVTALDGSTEVTFSYWVKYTNVSDHRLSGYIGPDDHAIRLGQQNGNNLFVNAGEHTDKHISYNLSEGRWYHLTLTAAVDGKWRVYANGTLIGTGTGGLPSESYYSAPFFGIGGAIEGSQSNLRHEIGGRVDDVRLYSHALSPAEVEHLYKYGNRSRTG